VTAVLGVAVEPVRTLLAVLAFGVVEAEAGAAHSVANAGRKILVTVAEASLAADVGVGSVSERSDDADVAVFAGRVVKTLVAVSDAVDTRRMTVAAAVDATVRP
jgi:hypothetical protein